MQLSTTDEIRRDDGGRRSKEEEGGKLAVEAEGAVIQESGRPPARCRPQKILMKHLLR